MYDSFNQATLDALYNKAVSAKAKYNKLVAIQNALTTLKGIISMAQTSFELANSNMQTAIESVNSAIIDCIPFTNDYIPIMESNGEIIKTTLEKNDGYLNDIGTALTKVDVEIETTHQEFQAAFEALNYYKLVFGELVYSSGNSYDV